MKTPFTFSVLAVALFRVSFPCRAASAAVSDAGVSRDASAEVGTHDERAAGDGATDASANDASSGTSSGENPFACNKALCDTTTGATMCSVARGFGPARNTESGFLSASVTAMGFCALVRRRHRAKDGTR
jgi:hypothetical protein